MKTLKNSNGFGIVIMLLMVVILGIIGFTGWYVWHAKQSTDEALNEASKSSNSQTVASKKKASILSKQEHLDIKEWGIKLPLSSAIADAYYVVSTNSESNGQPNTMWLGLKSLDNSGCAAAQANAGGSYPIGSVIKAQPNETDPVSGTPIKQLDPNGVTIGGYYYAYHSGIQGNSSTRCVTKANITNANSIDAAFEAAANKIVAE